jgi:hypothetical protein
METTESPDGSDIGAVSTRSGNVMSASATEELPLIKKNKHASSAFLNRQRQSQNSGNSTFLPNLKTVQDSQFLRAGD